MLTRVKNSRRGWVGESSPQQLGEEWKWGSHDRGYVLTQKQLEIDPQSGMEGNQFEEGCSITHRHELPF